MNSSVKNNEGSTWDLSTISQYPLPCGTIPKQTEPNSCQFPIEYTSPLADFSEPDGSELFTRRPTSSGGGKWPSNNLKSRNDNPKPYSKVHSESRKICLDNNLDLPKELKQLFAPLKCQLCNCEMGSPITAKGHYEGKKHLSNIKKWFSDHPELVGKFKVPEINRNIPFDPDKLHCKYCDVMLSSQQQAEAHYAGKKHQEVINSKTMKNAFFNSQTGEWERCEKAKEDKTGRFGIGLSFLKLGTDQTNTEDASGHKFFCDVCQIACPSRISLNDHLIGAKHKKKTAALSKDVPSPGGENPAYDELDLDISEEKRETIEKLEKKWNLHAEESTNFRKSSLLGESCVCRSRRDRKKSERTSANVFETNINGRERGKDYLQDLDLYCRVCDKTMADLPSLVRHLRESKNHVKKLQKTDSNYRCFACKKNFEGKDSMIEHLLSMGHEVVVAQNVFDYHFDRKTSETLDCHYCDFDACEIDDAIYHFLSDQHEERLKNPETTIDGTLVERPYKIPSESEGSCSRDPIRTKHFNERFVPVDRVLDSHIKKAAKDNILETVIKNEKKTPPPSDLSIYRTPSGKYYCQPCDVTVNSQAQFLQHSESRKHKHKTNSTSSKIK